MSHIVQALGAQRVSESSAKRKVYSDDIPLYDGQTFESVLTMLCDVRHASDLLPDSANRAVIMDKADVLIDSFACIPHLKVQEPVKPAKKHIGWRWRENSKVNWNYGDDVTDKSMQDWLSFSPTRQAERIYDEV